MVRDHTQRALAQRLAVEQSERRLPSIASGLVRSGRLVWFGGAGEVSGAPPTDETQYRCGSISKTFIAVEVMRLRDEGRFTLVDPISSHLPEVVRPEATISQLLSHTSGIRAETSGPWWERTPGIPFDALVSGSLRPEDVVSPPGRRFHYSNVGYAILGELIARTRRRPWDDVIAEELLGPLGMLRTTTRPIESFAHGLGVHPHADVVMAEPEHDAVSMAPAGQLWSTVDDLSRWSALLSGHHPELLAPGTLDEMREPMALNDTPDLPWTLAHGLGLQVLNRDGTRSFGHLGSMPGHLAVLRVDARSGDAVIVLTNATSGLSVDLDQDLLHILHRHEPQPPETWRPTPGGVDSATLEILGAWYWGTSTFVLSVGRGGDLELHALATGREASFRRSGAHTYVGLSGYYHGETLSVVRRADGSVSHLDIGSFVLTRSAYDPSAGVPGGVDPEGWKGSPPQTETGARHLLQRHWRRPT